MTYRILSLDGGGSWAMLQAMALKEIYKDREDGDKCRTILNDFQLIVANSGGSLTLAAMIEKETIDDVIRLFRDEDSRKAIFSSLSPFERIFPERIARWLGIGPKYKASRKIDGIINALPKRGHLHLDEIPAALQIGTHFMITGFDYDRQRSVFFRSNLYSKSASTPGKRVELQKAIHASSNAPVNYFDAPAAFPYQDYNRRFWDGAVAGYNNPCLAGVVEALANDHNMNEIQLRSIGTGSVSLPIKEQSPTRNFEYPFLGQDLEKQSLVNDIEKLSMSILSEPPDAASYMSHILLGGSAEDYSPPYLVRLSPLIQPYLKDDRWELPPGFDPKHFKKLIDLDMDAVEPDEVELIYYLGQRWVTDQVKNQPVRMGGAELACEIGHEFFSGGKAGWW